MRQTPWQRALLYTVVVVWSFVCLFPFYWLATTSLKTPWPSAAAHAISPPSTTNPPANTGSTC